MFFLIFHRVTLLKARNDVLCISSCDKEASSANVAGSSAVFTVGCSSQRRTVSLAYLVLPSMSRRLADRQVFFSPVTNSRDFGGTEMLVRTGVCYFPSGHLGFGKTFVTHALVK